MGRDFGHGKFYGTRFKSCVNWTMEYITVDNMNVYKSNSLKRICHTGNEIIKVSYGEALPATRPLPTGLHFCEKGGTKMPL